MEWKWKEKKKEKKNTPLWEAWLLNVSMVRVGLNPSRNPCVVLGQDSVSLTHSACLHIGVSMGTGKLFGQSDKMLEGSLRWNSILFETKNQYSLHEVNDLQSRTPE